MRKQTAKAALAAKAELIAGNLQAIGEDMSTHARDEAAHYRRFSEAVRAEKDPSGFSFSRCTDLECTICYPTPLPE